jgi:hypothetical protein
VIHAVRVHVRESEPAIERHRGVVRFDVDRHRQPGRSTFGQNRVPERAGAGMPSLKLSSAAASEIATSPRLSGLRSEIQEALVRIGHDHPVRGPGPGARRVSAHR